MFTRTILRRAISIAAMLLIVFGEARGQQAPIKVFVGFPAGGTTDIIGRLVAQELSQQLGRSVIVENKAGASGSIAAATVAKSKPDGNTILVAPSSHATNASLQKNLQFDTVKDFSAVGVVAKTPYVLVVHPGLPVRDVSSLVAHMKQHPGQIMFASASIGTGQHLAAELFKKRANVDITHVPYKGSSAALPDLASGRVPMMFDNIAVVLPHIKAGTVKPLATTASRRSPLLPSVATVEESGIPGYEVEGWFAVFVPSNTPQNVIDELNKVLASMVTKPQIATRLTDLGAEAMNLNPQASDAFVRSEVQKWGAIIQDANITIE